MQTLAIIAKTISTMGLVGLCFVLISFFLTTDILAERGLTAKQVSILVAILLCAIGIWFL